MEMNNELIIQRIKKLYEKYGVDKKFIDSLDEDDNKKIKGMKGILAELELNKMKDYSPEDLSFIREIYSKFC